MKDKRMKIFESTSIPKYCKMYIARIEKLVREKDLKIKKLEATHDLLLNYDWFTLGTFMEEKRGLFLLHKNGATRICVIGDGSVLLVGHKKVKKCGQKKQCENKINID